MLKEHGRTIENFLRISDLLLVVGSWYAAYFLRFEIMPDAQKGLFVEFSYIALFLILVSTYVYEKYNLYTSFRLKSLVYEVSLVAKANLVVFTILILAIYFFHAERISRVHLITFLLLSQIAFVFSRIIKANFLRNIRAKGKNLRHVKLVGDGLQLENFRKLIHSVPGSGLEIIDQGDIDAFIVGYKSESSSELNNFLKEHYNDVTPIHILPDLSYSLLGQTLEDIDGIPVITVNHPTFSTIELLIKRIVDIVACTFGGLVISPLLVLISLAVKFTSKGPIFYAQERVGIDGKPFKMWKFRSMTVAENNEDKTVWTSKNDSRITKIGAFIRKTSIDELPQLWNVIVGDMSLVGPRPERTNFVQQFKNEIPNYMLRHKMRAGITGWAQVNGWRGDTSLVKRIECDLYYIKNWSLWLDIKIILLSFVKGFVNKNAY